MEEVNRRAERERKGTVVGRKQRHTYYKHTRCSSAAQEEQSALPMGVLNIHEDSSDDEEYLGEQRNFPKG